MSATELSNKDVQGVISLVREVCDRWDDPAAWRAHLLRGACQLVNGNVGSIFGQEMPEPGQFGRSSVIAAEGLPEAMKKALMEPASQKTRNADIEAELEPLMPGMVKLFDDFTRNGWATAGRDEITDPVTYHASAAYNLFRKHADCDDYLISVRSVDEPTRVEVLSIDRPHGAPPFTAREVGILKLLHDEISLLIGVKLATEEHLCRDGLSKRLRETLSLLLNGHSEKQVADSLGLSVPTVHEYIGVLYRHFRVRSRAELMAYFIKRQPGLKSQDVL